METTFATALPSAVVKSSAQVVFTKEDTDRLFKALAEPLDPSVIKWVVKATADGKEGKRRGRVVASIFLLHVSCVYGFHGALIAPGARSQHAGGLGPATSFIIHISRRIDSASIVARVALALIE